MENLGKFDFSVLPSLGIDFLSQDIVGFWCEEDQVELKAADAGGTEAEANEMPSELAVAA